MPHMLLQIVLAICIIGVLVWVINQLPIDPTFQRIAVVVLIAVLVIWVLITLFAMLGVRAW